VRFLLNELGVAYEKVHVTLGDPRPGWYGEIQPTESIPFYEDDLVRIGESNAILRYLAARCDRLDLYPLDLAVRAKIDWAIDCFSGRVRNKMWPLEEAAIYYTNLENGGASAEGADKERVRRALGPAEAALGEFARILADQGYVAGKFSIADCCVAPTLWRTHRLPLDLRKWPRLAELRELICARDTFQRALADA
jgi:glutathione S-transferase